MNKAKEYAEKFILTVDHQGDVEEAYNDGYHQAEKDFGLSWEDIEAINQSFIYHESHGDDFRSDKQIETAYKYGFETGAKWADEHSIKVKEVDLEEHLKNGIDEVFYDLDGVAVKGTTHYITVEDVKDIAKHFFELGLKAQKGE